MKNFVIALFVVLLSSSSLITYAEAIQPEWQEFCPEEYLNSSYDNHVYYGYGLKEVLIGVTLIGFPINYKSWKKQLNADANNYWTSRRYSFEKELEICKAEPANQAMCYLKVREIEENKTAQWQLNNNLSNINNSIKRIRF